MDDITDALTCYRNALNEISKNKLDIELEAICYSNLATIMHVDITALTHFDEVPATGDDTPSTLDETPPGVPSRFIASIRVSSRL
jgi:hypothetical protein